MLFRSSNVDPERFVTANLPLLAGAPGSRAGSLPYGAEAASLILFGSPAADLKADQQYLLAAANWRPILLAPDDNPQALESVDKRWAALQKRASRCLHLLGKPGTPAYEVARQHLLAMRPPRLKDDILSGRHEPAAGFTTAVNPIRRARQFLGDGGLGRVGRDLADATTASWRGRIAKVDLSLNAAQNRQFGEQIEKALASIEQRLATRLRLRLAGPNDADDRAQVLVVVTDLDGNILRYFETGPAHGFDTPRPVASIGKALVAAPLLGRVRDTSDTLYCNRSVPGVHNAGGNEGAATCRSSHAWVRARDAYAKSLTLAFVNRLSAFPPETIRQTAKSLGFSLPADVPPQTSVPLGLFEATPRSVLQAMTGIGRVLAEMSGDVPSPRLVRQLGIISMDGSVLDQTTTLRSSLAGSDLLNDVAPAAQYLRQVLAAPLGAGGTLAPLSAYRADDNPRLRFHAAKTGTSTTPDRMTRDATIAGTFQTSDGRGFAYFILAGTADPRRPLGSINGGNLAPLARIVLEQAVRRNAMTTITRTRRRSLPDRMDAVKTPLVCIVLLFFEGFSIFSTGTGLHAFFNGFSNFTPPWDWVLVVALAAGFHFLGIAWFLKFRQTRRVAAILPYLVFSLVFVGYSWSWHWAHFRGTEVATQDLSAKVGELERTLYTARGAFALIAEETGELATYSEQRAAQEEKTGGTCGDVSGPKPGKRHWLRMDDNREAKSLAGAAHGQLDRLDALITQTRDLSAARGGITLRSQQLDTIYNELAAFVGNDAAVTDIRDRAEQRLRLSQNGYDVPGYGVTRCPDPTRDALLGSVLKAAKMPPVTVVHVMDPESVPEAQKRIWSRAAKTVTVLWIAVWGGRVDPETVSDQLNFSDYVALGTASFVEFSVLMCFFWLPRPRRGVGLLVDEVEGLDDERSPLLLAAFQRIAEGLNPREGKILAALEDHLGGPTRQTTRSFWCP